jgi:predicted permease
VPLVIKIRSLLRNLLASRRKNVDTALDDEVRFHFEMLVVEHIRAGMSPNEAQRAARIELGGVEQLKEQVRQERIGNWLHSALSDCAFALRQLRKSPAFTIAAILILALGIGANTAIFSLLDPLLLRELPVHNANELVLVNSTGTLGPAELSELDTFYAYRDKTPVFSSAVAFSRLAPYAVQHNDQTVLAQGELVSGNYFTALGIYPFAGRLFETTDEHESATIVLSFDFWRRAFDSDPNLIGKMVSFCDQADASHAGSSPQRSYTIVGIAPPGFFGAKVGESPDFYMPLGAKDPPSQDYWQTQGVTILARLKPGITIAQAQAALDPLLQEMGKTSAIPAIEWQESYAHALLTPAARGVSAARTKYSLPARILMAVVGLLLLIACANIANLSLARGMSRRREITVRLALGASRSRVIRQLLTESVLLAAAGGAAGLALGQWMSRLLLAALSTPQFPIVLETRFNCRLLLFAAALLALTMLICGLVPALSATRGKLAEELKTHTGGSHKSLQHSRSGRVLVVAQVALSTMLLAGAGLLMRSLFNLETFDAGFNRDKVLTVALNGYSATRTRALILDFYSQLTERVRRLPGVHSVSYSSFTPISGKEVGVNVIVEGYTMKPGEVANESLHPDRLIATLCGIFSILALALTCVGLYGLLAFDVARRTGEIGIRLALGARRGDILQLVVGQGMRWTFSGMLVGVLAALAAGSLIASMLFGVRKTDPLTFLLVLAILLAAAVLACYLPARRASRVDPMVALRYE